MGNDEVSKKEIARLVASVREQIDLKKIPELERFEGQMLTMKIERGAMRWAVINEVECW